MVTIFLFGCKNSGEEVSDEIVAEVYGSKLTKNKLLMDLEDKFAGADSAVLVEEYIKSWVRAEVLFAKAEDELSVAEKDKEAMLRAYYKDLLTFELRQKLLSRHLDYEVSEEEIATYYEKNKSNFELKENIVRLIFFKLSDKTPNLNRLWQKFVQGGSKNLEEITYAAINGGGNFHRDADVWLRFNDILKEIPITTYNQENYLSNHKLIQLSESGFTYFVNISDFRIKNNVSPLEREKERIKTIIINRRKGTLLKQLEDQIVNEAYNSNKVQIN
jgi:hypothetical protein